MKKVHQLLGLDRPLDGLFGIEIEAEGKRMQNVDNEFWMTENDRSLRGHFPENAAEFVLKKPIGKNAVGAAMDSLIESLPDAEFNFSFRTSVHVHVNVQDLTEEQVMNMIYAYTLLEEPLVNYCGRERKGNRFCLRIVDAENTVEILRTMFTKGLKWGMMLDQNGIRYSGLNIAALKKYGSIEFRSMRGNMDKEVILNWTRALGLLKEYAITKKNPKEVLEHYNNSEPAAFMKDILKDVFDVFKYPRMVKEIQRSYSLTLDLPYAYTDKEEEGRKKAEIKFEYPQAPMPLNYGDLVAAVRAGRNPRPIRVNVLPDPDAEVF